MTTLKPGDKAPEFEALNQKGETVRSSDFKGKKVLLFFYPKASTPGCTAEACNLRDNYETFLSKGYEVIGVSADTEKKQLNFSKLLSLQKGFLPSLFSYCCPYHFTVVVKIICAKGFHSKKCYVKSILFLSISSFLFTAH